MNNKVIKNAGWIIGCKIAESVLGLIVSMFTARYLGPSNFGLINYAASIVAFAAPIAKLGFDSVLVNEIVNNPSKEGETLGTAVAMTVLTGLITMLGVFLFCSVANAGEKETIVICVIYSFLLVAQAVEMIVFWFQAKLLSRYSAIISLAAYIAVSTYKIYLLTTGKNVYWFAASSALDYFIIGIGLFVVYYRIGAQKLTFSRMAFQRMFAKSKHYIMSNMMITVFAQTDKLMLKLLLDDSATGFYSAAVACAGMTGFIFSAVIDSVRPSVFECKKNDANSFKRNMVRLYSIIIWMAVFQSFSITIFAKFIISVLYGSEFLPAVNVLRLVVWYTTFSYLGSVRNIWILAENKQRVLWIINLSGAVTNVVLNFLLIPIYGTMGAALASVVTQFFVNIVMGYIIRDIRENNALMLQGANPINLKNIFEILKKNGR